MGFIWSGLTCWPTPVVSVPQNLSKQRADAANIPTYRLPIDRYMRRKDQIHFSQILAINQGKLSYLHIPELSKSIHSRKEWRWFLTFVFFFNCKLHPLLQDWYRAYTLVCVIRFLYYWNNELSFCLYDFSFCFSFFIITWLWVIFYGYSIFMELYRTRWKSCEEHMIAGQVRSIVFDPFIFLFFFRKSWKS